MNVTRSGEEPEVGVANNVLDGRVVPLTHECEQFGPTWSYVPEGHSNEMAVHAPLIDVVVVACGSGTAHLYDLTHPALSVFACHPVEQEVAGGSASGQDAAVGEKAQLSAMSERVRGPTTPYPVVAGVPDTTTLYFTCRRRTALSVPASKEPSVTPAPRRFCTRRNL